MWGCRGPTARALEERKSHYTLRCLASDIWLIKVNIFSSLPKKVHVQNLESIKILIKVVKRILNTGEQS